MTQLFSIGLAILLSAMLPGPDFALVMRNTLIASRRMGIYTSIGIVAGLLVHVTYCVLGLAVLILESELFFNLLKYAGSAYLFYLSATMLFGSMNVTGMQGSVVSVKAGAQGASMTPFKALRQGFICNVLNPKVALFFLALFAMVVTPETSNWLLLAIAIEILFIPLLWFSGLTIILSHPKVYGLLSRAEAFITRLLGVMLLVFAILLLMANK